MCLIDTGDYDPCELWQEKPTIARKHHKCSECRGPIEPGRMYIAHFSLFDGSVNSSKICEACHDDWLDFSGAHAGYRVAPPSLREVLAECIYEGDEESDRVWQPMLDRLVARAA